MTDNDFNIPIEDVTSTFNSAAEFDEFSEVLVVGRLKEVDAEGYEFYVASSTSTPKTIKLFQEATKEWKLDG